MQSVSLDLTTFSTSGSYYIFDAKNIKHQEAFGDQICIDKASNTVEITDFIDVDNKEIREFFRENFYSYRAILGFMRKVTE